METSSSALNIGQSQQNKKILQELEEKKRRMRSHTEGTTVSPIQINQPIQSSTALIDIPPQIKPQPQQAFATFFNSNTFGYFINTDSVFGNQILPVLPRF